MDEVMKGTVWMVRNVRKCNRKVKLGGILINQC